MQSSIDATSARVRAYDVAGAFLQYFFDLKNKDVIAGQVYAIDSSFQVTASGETDPTVFSGVDAIKEKFTTFPVSSIFVDSFDAQQTIADAIVILVTGREVIADLSYAFSRSMVLAKSSESFYLKTDILRYGASTPSDIFVGAVEATPAAVPATTVAAVEKPAPKPAKAKAPRQKKEKVVAEKVEKKVEEKKEEVKEEKAVEAVAEVPVVAVETEIKKKTPFSWASAVSGLEAPVTITTPTPTPAPVREERKRDIRDKKPTTSAPTTTANKSKDAELSPTNIYVARLTNAVSLDDLTEHFAQYGTCKKVDYKIGNTFAYIHYEQAASSVAALEKPDPVVNGVTVMVNRARVPAKKTFDNKKNNTTEKKTVTQKQ